MKGKIIKILILAVAIIGIIVAAIFGYINSRFNYNIDNATGNTAGNLNNGGTFAEYDGKIYFANPYDSGRLYVMNTDCTDAKRLNTDSVSSLNVCGSYIYYVKNNYSRDAIDTGARVNMYGVYRTDLKGNNPTSLYETLSGVTTMYGNYLYYQHYTDTSPLSFHKVKIDGKEDTELSKMPINPACIYNNKVYFANAGQRNNIYTYDIRNGSLSRVNEANAYLVDTADNYIYYIDLAKNYSLVRYNVANGTTELLYAPDNGKVVTYNRYGNKIFFSVEGEERGLYRMNANGTQIEFLVEGNIVDIQCTSKYTFFQYFENAELLYRVPTTGSITKIEEITILKEE
ncbi:MAG: DUF5050 domain-containing protein [Lachnospira sp.]|nr:DUF5050 domain-containing protein [Lachnospira sp.]